MSGISVKTEATVYEEQDIDISKSLDGLHDYLINSLGKNVSEELLKTKVYNSAKEFVSIYQKNIALVNTLTKEIEEIKKQEKEPNAAPALEAKRKNKISQRLTYFKEYYMAAFEFDELLSRFLYGEDFPKKALYIVENKDGSLSTYEMSMKDIVKYLINEEGRIKPTKASLTEATKGFSAIEKQSKEGDEWSKRVTVSQAAYIGSTNRLNAYYNRREQAYEKGNFGEIKYDNKGKVQKLQAQAGFLLWKEGRRWQKIQVTNSGDLKEGYSSMLFNEHMDNINHLIHNLGTKDYYSHELIKAFAQHIGGVGNKPAILEEDIITSYAQYGIKSYGAALPTINQYVYAANAVIYNVDKNITDPTYIAGVIANKYNKDIKRNVNKAVNKETNNVLKTVKKDLTNALKNN